jgi:2',5'-phosphodiesterase
METPNFLKDEIHVYLNEVESIVNLSFFEGGQIHTMNRPMHDSMSKTVTRLIRTITELNTSNKEKRKNKKNNRNSANTDCSVLVEGVVLFNDEPVDILALANKDWKTNMIVLCGKQSFKVLLSPPTVTSLTSFPRKKFIVGNPIVALSTTSFASGIDYLWCYQNDSEGVEYKPCCNEREYVPSSSSVGSRLKLYCTPWKMENSCKMFGRTFTLHLNNLILPSQGIPGAIDCRQDFMIVSRNIDEIRVVTFNILAELFATQDYSIKVLYPYCDPMYLETEHRAQSTMLELLAYNADVLFLQECDHKLFHQYYMPILGSRGYDGHYTNKSSMVLEGCATFTLKSKLTVIQRVDVPLKSVLQNADYLKHLYSYRSDIQDLIGGKIGTIVQFTICKVVDESRCIIFVNTHLFYHPAAGYIRLLQVHSILEILKHIKSCIEIYGEHCDLNISAAETTLFPSQPMIDNDMKQVVDDVRSITTNDMNHSHDKKMKVSCIFGGDLNSTRNSAVVEYLNT